MKGTLTEGYYKAGDLNVSGSLKTNNKEYTVTAASAKITSTSAPLVKESGITLVDALGPSEQDSDYVSFDISGTIGNEFSGSVVNGYLNNAEKQITFETSALTPVKKYIKKNKITSITIGANNETTHTENIAETYNSSGITVNLHEDAMGSAVQFQMRRLEARLGGNALPIA